MKILLYMILLAPTLGGCNGLGAAAQDFIDPYKVTVGVGSGAGARFACLGLVDTGLSMGVKPNAATLGLRYGRGFAFLPDSQGVHFYSDQAKIFETRHLVDADYSTGAFDVGRRSFALLPAAFTWVDSADRERVGWTVPEEGVDLAGEHYLWSARTWRDERYAMIHAFDVEAEVMLLGYIELGVSVGEALDFVTSLFGLDLAGDDDR